MNATHAIDILNRVYAIHNRSLPIYLSDAQPWRQAGDEESAETLAQIVEDQKSMVDSLGELILDLGGDVEAGIFPMAFTGFHDLGIDYLIGQAILYQKSEIATMEKCVDQLKTNPMAQALVEEALGAAKGHLDSLEELTSQANKSD